jgi:hypothetical protein
VNSVTHLCIPLKAGNILRPADWQIASQDELCRVAQVKLKVGPELKCYPMKICEAILYNSMHSSSPAPDRGSGHFLTLTALFVRREPWGPNSRRLSRSQRWPRH